VTGGGSRYANAVAYSDENLTDNPAAEVDQYGDYSGVSAANRQVRPFWTDSRNFFPTQPMGDLRVEDGATAVVTNCSAPTFAVTPSAACSANGIQVNWTAATAFGTNATAVTYTLTRYTDMGCSMNPFVVASGV